MLYSCRVADTTSAANEAAAVRYGSKGAEVYKVLDVTTAGFPVPRNNSRDINSKDSLINYLRHPAGLLCGALITRFRRASRGKFPGLVYTPGVSQHRLGRIVPQMAKEIERMPPQRERQAL
jgi:hypothetical protein